MSHRTWPQRQHALLTWCAARRRTRRFKLPTAVLTKASPLGQQERLSVLGRRLTIEDIPLRTRGAGSIVLLYAQPLTRVVRLTLDDVIRDRSGHSGYGRTTVPIQSELVSDDGGTTRPLS